MKHFVTTSDYIFGYQVCVQSFVPIVNNFSGNKVLLSVQDSSEVFDMLLEEYFGGFL